MAEEPWRVKAAFIRKTCLFFCLLTAAAAMVGGAFRFVAAPEAVLAAGALALALVLNGVRTMARGSRIERVSSLVLSPFVVAGYGLLFNALLDRGVPVWGLPIGLTACTVFALLAGRDFSFIGQFAASQVASAAVIAAVSISLGLSHARSAAAFGINAVFILYFVYDLNSILSRRTKGEEIHAALDFFRDIFNFIGYFIRCWHHWIQNKIFVPPKFP